jgi:anti-sigma B factor antagonist
VEKHQPAWGALQCRTETRAEAVVVVPSGEVDLGTVPVLSSALQVVLDGGHHAVILLKELKYIDSTGIKAILDVHRMFAEHGRRLMLADPPAVIRRVLDIVGIEKVIEVYPSIDSALASCSISAASNHP